MTDYSRDEAEEILRRALTREERDGISHEDLVAAAAEVGIEADDVERAAAELAREQQRRARGAEIRAELRRDFLQRVGSVLGLGAMLLVIDVMAGPGFWVQWAALGLAIYLGGRAIRAFAPSDSAIRRAEKRIEKRARRRRKREREWAPSKRKDKRKDKRAGKGEAEAQFERVVEEGVEALLRSAGDQLERYNDSRRDPKGSGRPRVRVEDREGDREPDDDLRSDSHGARHKRRDI